MRPFSSGAYFLNYLGEEGGDAIKAAFGPNYDRLKAVKKKCDPENFFCLNQNVRNSGSRVSGILIEIWLNLFESTNSASEVSIVERSRDCKANL